MYTGVMDGPGCGCVELLFIGFRDVIVTGGKPAGGENGRRFVFPLRPGQTVKHLAEKSGVPHTELGRIETRGERVADSYVPCPGEKLFLYPVPRRRAAGREPSFLLDVHLGKLARYLRLLGFDAAYRNDLDDDEIVRIARQEKRVILTRDRRLLMRRAVAAGRLVGSGDPFRQVVEVVLDFGLEGELRPFSRCARCGSPLRPAEEPETAELPEIVRLRYRRFLRCSACSRLYWRGDHFKNIESFLERLKKALGA